jgi:hypothetical protein
LQGYLSFEISDSVIFALETSKVLGKYPSRGKIPSLNSL